TRVVWCECPSADESVAAQLIQPETSPIDTDYLVAEDLAHPAFDRVRQVPRKQVQEGARLVQSGTRGRGGTEDPGPLVAELGHQLIGADAGEKGTVPDLFL